MAQERIQSWVSDQTPTFRFCVSVARTLSHELAERQLALDLGVVCEVRILPEHSAQLGDELVVWIRVLPSQAMQLA